MRDDIERIPLAGEVVLDAPKHQRAAVPRCRGAHFVGREALLAIDRKTDRPVRVGLKLGSRRIAREHSEVFSGTERVGEVTSGTFSPTLESSIAMAYVTRGCAGPGTVVEVDIRGKREPAEVVPLPFYKRVK